MPVPGECAAQRADQVQHGHQSQAVAAAEPVAGLAGQHGSGHRPAEGRGHREAQHPMRQPVQISEGVRGAGDDGGIETENSRPARLRRCSSAGRSSNASATAYQKAHSRMVGFRSLGTAAGYRTGIESRTRAGPQSMSRPDLVLLRWVWKLDALLRHSSGVSCGLAGLARGRQKPGTFCSVERVVMADGSPPPKPVGIEYYCPGKRTQVVGIRRRGKTSFGITRGQRSSRALIPQTHPQLLCSKA